jgi:phosphoribosylanthranilate isomerase
MTKIKICGLKRKDDIEFANQLKPDFVGFIFAGDKRKVSFENAKYFKSILDKRIKSVGVFVNESTANIFAAVNEKIINLVQLHGDESEDYIKELKLKIEIPVIKAVRVKEKIENFNTAADFVLFDNFSKNIYGGTGETFNWNFIENYKEQFFLAGGLNEKNIKTAIEKLNPYCIDVSGGVETGGVKDFKKMMNIIEIVRESESDSGNKKG